MNDHSSHEDIPLSPMGYPVGTAAGGGSGGTNEHLGFEPPPHGNPQRPPAPEFSQQNGNLQNLQQDPSSANITLHHSEWQHDGSAYADQSGWYRQQNVQGETIDPALLTLAGVIQDYSAADSQYSEPYLEIGGQFGWSESLLVPAGAKQEVEPDHRHIAVSSQYSPSLDFNAEQVLNEPVELPEEGRSQLGDAFHTQSQECVPMSAILGRSLINDMGNRVPNIVVSPLIYSGQFAFELQDVSDLSARRASGPYLPLPDGAPPSPGSVVSGGALRCLHKGCNSEFNGAHRRGNLARHCRLKHRGRVVKYRCEDKDCIRVFMRQDARLKHYRKYHPELANKSVMLQESSTSTRTGSVGGYLNSPQGNYSMTSPCDSQSINDFDTPALSVGDDNDYRCNPCTSLFD